MVVRIADKRMYPWRAVDHEGEILDILVHRESGSHQTPRWREPDSNPRSPVSRIYANTGIAPDRDTGRANRRENGETAGLAPLRDQRR
jgi:hypothetical protein